MKNKYIKKQTLMAARSKRKRVNTDIYVELEKTIAERKILLQQWEKIFAADRIIVQKDIHVQLAETIAEFKKAKQLLDTRLFGDKPTVSLDLTRTTAA